MFTFGRFVRIAISAAAMDSAAGTPVMESKQESTSLVLPGNQQSGIVECSSSLAPFVFLAPGNFSKGEAKRRQTPKPHEHPKAFGAEAQGDPNKVVLLDIQSKRLFRCFGLVLIATDFVESQRTTQILSTRRPSSMAASTRSVKLVWYHHSRCSSASLSFLVCRTLCGSA